METSDKTDKKLTLLRVWKLEGQDTRPSQMKVKVIQAHIHLVATTHVPCYGLLGCKDQEIPSLVC